MKRIAWKAFASFALAAFILLSQSGPARAEQAAAASIPARDLVQPADLASILKSASPKPLLLQVGFRALYIQAHIPESEYLGPASDDAGLRLLRARVEKLTKESAIVLYCGCCPWSHCPNVAAAYNELHALGFTQVRVLYVADNFGADWVDKGYPVAKGP